MLDLEQDDLILQMCQFFFNIIREHHLEEVKADMWDILSSILFEGDIIRKQLQTKIISHLEDTCCLTSCLWASQKSGWAKQKIFHKATNPRRVAEDLWWPTMQQLWAKEKRSLLHLQATLETWPLMFRSHWGDDRGRLGGDSFWPSGWGFFFYSWVHGFLREHLWGAWAVMGSCWQQLKDAVMFGRGDWWAATYPHLAWPTHSRAQCAWRVIFGNVSYLYQ